MIDVKYVPCTHPCMLLKSGLYAAELREYTGVEEYTPGTCLETVPPLVSDHHVQCGEQDEQNVPEKNMQQSGQVSLLCRNKMSNNCCCFALLRESSPQTLQSDPPCPWCAASAWSHTVHGEEGNTREVARGVRQSKERDWRCLQALHSW